jgi:DnaJ-class molecular chaperone
MSPNTVKLVEDEGLVYDTGVRSDATERDRLLAARNEGKRGNLFILFDVVFPKNLNKVQKLEIENLLKVE